MVTIICREVRERRPYGKLAVLSFVFFNGVMLAVVTNHFIDSKSDPNRPFDLFENISQIITATSKLASIIGIWVVGAVVLGMLSWLTRGKITVVDEWIDERPPADPHS